MAAQTRHESVAGDAFGGALIGIAAGDPVAVRICAAATSREPAFRARLLVGRGAVPSGAEAETLRWLQIARWSPRLDLSMVDADFEPGPTSVAQLVDAAKRQCLEVESELQRIGGPRAVLVADLDRLTEQIDTWPPEVGPILRRVDGVRTVLGVAAKAQPTPVVTLRILARLVAGGVLLVGSYEPEDRDAVVSPEPLPD